MIYTKMKYVDRVAAFEECLLHTCIRFLERFWEGLTIYNYMDAEGFPEAARNYLETNSLFVPSIESAMGDARFSLINKLRG